MRSRAVPEGRGSVPRDAAERRDPLRRARLRARRGRAARTDGDLRGRRAGARHLLRRAGDGARSSAARSRAAITANSAVPRSRSSKTLGALSTACGRSGERYPVWMSHGDRVTRLPPGFRGGRHVGECADRDDRRRSSANSTPPSSISRSMHTPQGAAILRNFVRKIVGARRRLDHARLQGGGDREDPQPGRQGRG